MANMKETRAVAWWLFWRYVLVSFIVGGVVGGVLGGIVGFMVGAFGGSTETIRSTAPYVTIIPALIASFLILNFLLTKLIGTTIKGKRKRFVLAVLEADELNAFASGGHLVVVTSYAVEVLPDPELAGVLAHELSHHLGLHTVALTITQWLLLPVVLLARIGFLFRAIARAATDSFASNSPALSAVGRLISGTISMVAWVFLAGVLVSNAIGNAVGRGAEFQADRRAVSMGFGPQLAAALRRFVASGLAERPVHWHERLFASHPPARTRVARIEAMLRQRWRSHR